MLVLMVADIQAGGFYHSSIVTQVMPCMRFNRLLIMQIVCSRLALSSSLSARRYANAFGIGQRMHPHSRAFHPGAHLGTGRTRGFLSIS